MVIYTCINREEIPVIFIHQSMDGCPVSHKDDYAFERTLYITEVKFPEVIIYIGEEAFYFCKSLKLIVERGSYAAKWAKENGIEYKYASLF